MFPCPINFGDCSSCEHYKEGECQYKEEEKQCSVCKRKISFEDWESFGGMCARCEDMRFDSMMMAVEEGE